MCKLVKLAHNTCTFHLFIFKIGLGQLLLLGHLVSSRWHCADNPLLRHGPGELKCRSCRFWHVWCIEKSSVWKTFSESRSKWMAFLSRWSARWSCSMRIFISTVRVVVVQLQENFPWMHGCHPSRWNSCRGQFVNIFYGKTKSSDFD